MLSPSFSSNITIIDKRDSPRKRPYTQHIKRVHPIKPIITYDKDMNLFYCYTCGNYVKPQNLREHKRL